MPSTKNWALCRSLITGDAHLNYVDPFCITGPRDEIITWLSQSLFVIQSNELPRRALPHRLVRTPSAWRSGYLREATAWFVDAPFTDRQKTLSRRPGRWRTRRLRRQLSDSIPGVIVSQTVGGLP